MPKGRRKEAATLPESEEVEARPKRKRVRKTGDPAPLSEILPAAFAHIPGLMTAAELPPPDREIVAHPDRDPVRKAEIETELPAEPENNAPLSHVERLSQRGLRPAPTGFLGMEGHYHAGIRLSRSLDKNVVAIQFAEDQRPSRDGSHPEVEQLHERGFAYRPERGQWERFDRRDPGESYQDAKAFVKKLVDDRLKEPNAGIRRA